MRPSTSSRFPIFSLPKGEILHALDIPVATFNRNVQRRERLSHDQSERVINFARLLR